MADMLQRTFCARRGTYARVLSTSIATKRQPQPPRGRAVAAEQHHLWSCYHPDMAMTSPHCCLSLATAKET